ncbi:MAG: DUF4815 domain-containing protein, partial [Planctomycetota bacterium]
MLDFNSTPYFDDYDELKKFVRILFRPSKAVQTRELTQAQTILQNQVSRLGDYNFEEGSIVTGCETQLDLEYNYVKIVNPPPIDLITLIGFRDIRLFGNVSKVNARLVNYLPADVSDPETLYVKYFDSGEDSGENSTFFDNELITVTIFDFDGNQEGSSFSLSTQASDSTGVGSAISISEGVRYALGFFLLVEKQSLIIDKYGNQPTARLGFDVRESIITETDDPTLLDNALGSPNATAPGAHRYKIELVLSKTEDEDKENFIELVSLENGKILEDLTTAELASSGILVELAKRTYDANGDFIVEDFKSEIREHLNDGTNRGKFTEAQGGQEDLLVVDIDSGRAYVSGYEVKTTGQEAVVISKAREEAVGNNSTVFGDIGAYIRVDNLVYYPDIENYTQIELRNVATPIGYARVRSVDYRQADDEHRFYLFDIQMNSGELISNADNFVDTGAFASLAGDILDQDGVRLFERTNNVGIKTFPFNSVSNVTDITYDSHVTFVQKTAAGTPTSTVFWDVGSGQRFVPFSARNYMLFNVSNNTYLTLQEDNPANPNYIQLTNNNTRVTISQLSPPTQDYVLIASVSKEVSPIAKQKTRQVVTSNFLIEESAPSEDERFILLKKPDIIELVSVVFDGADITDRYILDNGQRDGYYGLGRLLPVNPSTALAVGEQVEVTFSYYSHTGGDYFVVDSYPEEDYADIQNYVSTNGVEFDLRNAIDFRPTIGEDGTFTGSGSAKGDFWSN